MKTFKDLVFAGCVSLVAIFALNHFAGCATLSAQDKKELAEYDAAQDLCLTKSNLVLQDECKADVRKEWAAQWNKRFDGGFE